MDFPFPPDRLSAIPQSGSLDVPLDTAVPAHGTEQLSPADGHNPHSTDYPGGPSAEELRESTSGTTPVTPEPVARGIGAASLGGEPDKPEGRSVPDDQEIIEGGAYDGNHTVDTGDVALHDDDVMRADVPAPQNTSGSDEDKRHVYYLEEPIEEWPAWGEGFERSPFMGVLRDANAGEDVTEDDAVRIACENNQEVLQSLPTIPTLPACDRLSEIRDEHDYEPLRIEEPVTAGMVQSHFDTVPTDPVEMGVYVFGDTATMRVGDFGVVPGHDGWQPFDEKADVSLHTHPPFDGEKYDEPSLDDLEYATHMGKPILIAHTDGILLCPPCSEGVGLAMSQYMERVGITGPEEHGAYGLDRFHAEFMRAQGVKGVMWDEIDPSMTLPEVQRYVEEHGH